MLGSELSQECFVWDISALLTQPCIYTALHRAYSVFVQLYTIGWIVKIWYSCNTERWIFWIFCFYESSLWKLFLPLPTQSWNWPQKYSSLIQNSFEIITRITIEINVTWTLGKTQCFSIGCHKDNLILITRPLHKIPFWNLWNQRSTQDGFLGYFCCCISSSFCANNLCYSIQVTFSANVHVTSYAWQNKVDPLFAFHNYDFIEIMLHIHSYDSNSCFEPTLAIEKCVWAFSVHVMCMCNMNVVTFWNQGRVRYILFLFATEDSQ